MIDRPTHHLAGLQAVGRVVSLGLQLVHFALLARVFGPDAFGPFAAGLAVASMAGVVAEFGVPTTVLVQRADTPSPRLWAVAVRAVLASTTIGVALAALVAVVLLDGPARQAALVLLGWTVAGRLRLVAVAVRQADLDAVRVVAAELSARIVATGAAAVAVAIGGDAWTTLIVVAAGMAAGELVGVAVAWPGWPTAEVGGDDGGGAWPEAVALLRRSRDFGLTASAASVHSRLDQILLDATRTAGGGAYAVAYRLVDASLAVMTMATSLVVPLLARCERPERERLARALTAAAVVFAAVLCGALVATAPVVVRIVGGAGYEEAVVLVRLLAVVLALAVVNVPLLHLVMVEGRSDRLFRISTVMIAVNLGLNLALLPRWGVTGAAVATMISEASGLVLVTLEARRHHPRVLPGINLWREMQPLRSHPAALIAPTATAGAPSADGSSADAPSADRP
ncbi:MAG: lipopolysaccharide biosynthesis protein [Actinomycetota bacterium]